MHNLENLKDFLESPKNAVILPHSKPDADALGSCLALSRFLKKLGHTTTVISPTDYPRFLFWMAGNDDVLNFENKNQKALAVDAFQNADIIFCLDFSSTKRVKGLEPLLVQAEQPKVIIDHHRGKEDFASYELWDINAAATCELIIDFIDLLGYKNLMDIDMAECIYAGIMTDTGSFKYHSTSSKVHRQVADLIDLGLEAEKIHRYIFDTSSEARLKFLGHALYNKLTILEGGKAAYFAITRKELDDFDTQTGDTEGLVNYALSIEGVDLAALFKEDGEGGIKMSFRSIGDVSVCDMATKYFDGGGHKNASGGRLEGIPLESVVDKFISVVPEFV